MVFVEIKITVKELSKLLKDAGIVTDDYNIITLTRGTGAIPFLRIWCELKNDKQK